MFFSLHTITEVCFGNSVQSNRQGGARAVDLLARLFDLARPGVAPPLVIRQLQIATSVDPNHNATRQYETCEVNTFICHRKHM